MLDLVVAFIVGCVVGAFRPSYVKMAVEKVKGLIAKLQPDNSNKPDNNKPE